MGMKNKDLVDWCKVVELMKAQAHLTEEGLEQIRKKKDGMVWIPIGKAKSKVRIFV
jgi:hypothetical protein